MPTLSLERPIFFSGILNAISSISCFQMLLFLFLLEPIDMANYLYYVSKYHLIQCGIQMYFTSNINQICGHDYVSSMGLLPDTQNGGLWIRRECRERFPCHQLQKKPPVSDPGMYHGMCDTYMPWCTSGSLTDGGGENIPAIPGACSTRNFTYLVRSQWNRSVSYHNNTRQSKNRMQLVWRYTGEVIWPYMFASCVFLAACHVIRYT